MSLSHGKSKEKAADFVDIVAQQDKTLMNQIDNKVEFLKSIQPPGTEMTFGKKGRLALKREAKNP
jgi:hypothetical protein